jgi:hypothetical protein
MSFRALFIAALILASAACTSSHHNTSGTTTTSSATGSTTPTTTPGPTQDVAPAGATGETVDSIPCAPLEQLAYHIHAHLSVFVNGQPKAVPQGIGINDQTCIYWLHTHTNDGILHIESPTSNNYTLGTFFDIWHQPLSPTQVGPAQGQLTVLVNGKLSNENPSLIVLDSHTDIQLDVGQPVVPYKAFKFPAGA